MKKVFVLSFVSLLAATPVLAEWNPVKDTANQLKGSAFFFTLPVVADVARR